MAPKYHPKPKNFAIISFKLGFEINVQIEPIIKVILKPNKNINFLISKTLKELFSSKYELYSFLIFSLLKKGIKTTIKGGNPIKNKNDNTPASNLPNMNQASKRNITCPKIKKYFFIGVSKSSDPFFEI